MHGVSEHSDVERKSPVSEFDEKVIIATSDVLARQDEHPVDQEPPAGETEGTEF